MSLKKRFILLGLIAFNSVFAQKKDNQFRFDNLSISFSKAYTSENHYDLGVAFELAIAKNNHLLKIHVGGVSYLIFSEEEYFEEFNLIYSRVFKLNGWMDIDIGGGLGYAVYSRQTDTNSYSSTKTDSKNSTIGFPIQGRLRFLKNKILSLGIEQYYNINQYTLLSKTGLFIQFNF